MKSNKASSHELQHVLAVNIGNTVTKLGVFAGDDLVATWVVTTPSVITTSEVKSVLMTFAAACDFDWNITGSIVSSVAPRITDAWIAALAHECGRRPLVVGPGLKSGIKLGYSDPSEIGADRIADMVGARAIYGSPLVVINLEAATTLEVIDDKGDFVGGIIAPGLESSASTLSAIAAKIPVIDLKAPSSVIGKSTREAVQAGVVLGEIARIDGLVEAIWNELGYQTNVVAAGSGAAVIQALSKTVNETVENLTLRGLKVLYDRNTR